MTRQKKAKAVVAADMKRAWLEAFAIRHGGRISPEKFLEDASDPSCPFHDELDWNDDEAAHHWRLAQAAGIIRRWKGELVRVNAELKAVQVSVTRRTQSPASGRGKGRPSYELIENIMADPEKREDLMQTVLRELMAYRRRYAELHALAEVWDSIDLAVERYGRGRGDTDHDGDRPTA